jgi:plastocyanin
VRSRHGLGLVAGLVLAVAACGGDASPTPSADGSPTGSAGVSPGGPAGLACAVAAADASPAATVEIRDFTYDPASLSVTTGDVVAFTNADTATHTATSTACDSGTIGKGATVAIEFTAPGEYVFSCRIHSTMPSVTVTVAD